MFGLLFVRRNDLSESVVVGKWLERGLFRYKEGQSVATCSPIVHLFIEVIDMDDVIQAPLKHGCLVASLLISMMLGMDTENHNLEGQR